MTKAELRAETRRLIGHPIPDEVPAHDLDAFLQAAIEAFNRRCSVAWATDTSLTTVANQQEYDLPVTLVEVKWVELSSTLLKMIDEEEWQRRYVAWRTTAAGTPTEYAIYNRKLILHPKPSANGTQLTLRGPTTPATIPTGGPTELPNQDHRPLCYYAASLFHATQGDPNRSKALRELFETEAQFARGYSVEARKVAR